MEFKKKILIAMPSYYGQTIGGAEYQIFLIAKELISSGHDVHYIFLKNRRQIDIALKGCVFHSVKRVRKTSRTGIEVPLYIRKVFQVIKDINPDVIYARGRSAISVIIGLYSRIFKVRSIIHLSHDNNLLKQKFEFSLKYIPIYLEQQLFFKVLSFYDIIISQTNSQAKKLKELFDLKSIVIPNGHPPLKIQHFKKSKKALKVLWIGNMKPNKQPEVFIKLANILGPEIKNCEFIMIGRPYKDCRLNDYIIGKSKRYLYVLGEISNNEVNNFLKQGHVLVNTSLAEGLPNTFIQAWMRNVPVVSLYADPNNIIKKEKLGYVSKDFNQLILDLKMILQNQQLREKLGKSAHNFALNKFSMKNIYKTTDIIANQSHKLISEVVKGNGK